MLVFVVPFLEALDHLCHFRRRHMILRLVKDAIPAVPDGFTYVVPDECQNIVIALLGILYVWTGSDCLKPL